MLIEYESFYYLNNYLFTAFSEKFQLSVATTKNQIFKNVNHIDDASRNNYYHLTWKTNA